MTLWVVANLLSSLYPNSFIFGEKVSAAAAHKSKVSKFRVARRLKQMTYKRQRRGMYGDVILNVPKVSVHLPPIKLPKDAAYGAIKQQRPSNWSMIGNDMRSIRSIQRRKLAPHVEVFQGVGLNQQSAANNVVDTKLASKLTMQSLRKVLPVSDARGKTIETAVPISLNKLVDDKLELTTSKLTVSQNFAEGIENKTILNPLKDTKYTEVKPHSATYNTVHRDVFVLAPKQYMDFKLIPLHEVHRETNHKEVSVKSKPNLESIAGALPEPTISESTQIEHHTIPQIITKNKEPETPSLPPTFHDPRRVQNINITTRISRDENEPLSAFNAVPRERVELGISEHDYHRLNLPPRRGDVIRR